VKTTETLIDWLKAEMRKREFSQADLARALGKSEATLSRILNGISGKMDPATAAGLCQWAGITEYQLLSISRGEGVGGAAGGAPVGNSAAVSPRLQSLVNRLNALAPEDQARIIDGLDLILPLTPDP
tara:strand:- start:882 stop:1262 length:381 start_codon:yes stop_codon:yes gene_type:complete